MTTFGRLARCSMPVLGLAAIALPGQAVAKPGVKPPVLQVCMHGCAYSTVQAAIDAAPQVATITVAAGTYVGGIESDRGQTLTISGAGEGRTILSGPGAYEVGVDNGYGTTTLSGMTITGDNSTDGLGAAVRNEATLTLENVAVSGNSTAGSAGPIFNYVGSLTIRDSVVSNNAGDAVPGELSEGAIVNDEGGSLRVQDTLVTNNQGFSFGGAIYNDGGGSLTVSDSTLANNTAADSGGAIMNQGNSSAVISDTTISGNTAAVGGGIYNASGGDSIAGINPGATLTLTDSQVTGNTATSGQGSGIFNDVGNPFNPGVLHMSDTTVALNNPVADQCHGC